MSINFLVFIGSLLACSIALAVTVKKVSEGFAVSGKKPYVYGTLSAILTSVAAYLITYISTNPFQTYWFFGGLFLLFGIIHILFVHNRYFYAYKVKENKVLLAEVLFSLSVILFAIVVFASLQYFIKDKDFLFYPIVTSALLFFVPLLVLHSYKAAYNIPGAVFPTWQYPLHKEILLPEESINEKVLVIGFEIAKKNSDEKKTYFRAKAPETMKLGDLFYHFINDYNDLHNEKVIEYTDNEVEPFEWWFRRKPKWYQFEKILNPELSVRENGITENTVVTCERIANSMAPPQYNKTYYES